jgi:hypothetical protein
MSANESESWQDGTEGSFSSEGVVDLVIDGPFDLTVRPMRESLRKLLEAKELIPRRPPMPEAPPAPSDKTPP